MHQASLLSDDENACTCLKCFH